MHRVRRAAPAVLAVVFAAALSVAVAAQAAEHAQPDEHAAIAWCSLEEAQSRLAAAHPRFCELLAQALSVGSREG